MRIFFLSLVCGFVFLIIQTALLSFFIPPQIIPDIILILVFYLSIYLPSWQGALSSFILGYFVDVFSGGAIGVSSFSLTTAFFILYQLSKKMDFTRPFVRVVGVIIIAIVNGLIVLLILKFTGSQREISLIFFRLILPNAIITGGLSPFFLNILNRLEALLLPKGSERPSLGTSKDRK